MNAQTFREALGRLDMSQAAFSHLTGCNERTVRRWADGQQDIPHWVPVIIGLIEQVRELATEILRMRGASQ